MGVGHSSKFLDDATLASPGSLLLTLWAACQAQRGAHVGERRVERQLLISPRLWVVTLCNHPASQVNHEHSVPSAQGLAQAHQAFQST